MKVSLRSNTRISTASQYEQRVTDVPASVTDRGYTYLGARCVGLPDDYSTRFLILINGQPMMDGAVGSIDLGTAELRPRTPRSRVFSRVLSRIR